MSTPAYTSTATATGALRTAGRRAFAPRGEERASGAFSRSPLVGVAISMAVVGLLIAATPPTATERLLWLLPLLAVSVEREIRSGSVPLGFGAFILGAHAFFHLATIGTVAYLPHLLGGLTTAALAWPLLYLGRVGPGSVICAGALGAVLGSPEIADMIGVALVFGLPLTAWMDRRARRTTATPLMTLLGFASAVLWL